MTNPFIEKLAKAHYDYAVAQTLRDHPDASYCEWDALIEFSKNFHRGYVRAVLTAMREPSEEMYAASRFPNAGSIGDQWRAMIDSALEDK